jgi:hypothetical protein
MSYQQDPYAPQDIYAQQQRLAQGDPYAQPGTYPPAPQQPYAQPSTYPPAPQQPYAQPSTYPPAPQQPYAQPSTYPPAPQQPYAQPSTYPPAPQQPYAPGIAYPPQQPGARMKNPWASRALFSGVFSVILGAITLASLIGFAGLITGTFAIWRGITAINYAKGLPGNPGRGMAITAIVLGALGWIFVLLSFVLRA